MRSADRGNRFAEGEVIWGHEPEIVQPEIRHGAGGRTDIQRIPGGDEDDTERGRDITIFARPAGVKSKLCACPFGRS